MKKEFMRENWIEVIKGIACIIVFLQHFTLSFTSNVLWNNGIFKVKSIVFTVNGNFAVCIFLLISFFLTAKKIFQREITSHDIAVMTVKRYLRLTIPVAIASAFAFIMQETIGFQNHMVSMMDGNTWFDNFYKDRLTIRYFFLSVFYRVLWDGDYRFNGPFWMLTVLFKGFFITIVIACIAKNISITRRVYFFLTVSLIYYLQNSLLLICIFSVLLAMLDSEGIIQVISSKQGSKIVSLFLIIILLISMGYVNDLIMFIRNHVRANSFLAQTSFWNSMIAFVIFFSSKVMFDGRKINDRNIFVIIGNRSMGIYLFHWPIICSISSMIYISVLKILHKYCINIKWGGSTTFCHYNSFDYDCGRDLYAFC